MPCAVASEEVLRTSQIGWALAVGVVAAVLGLSLQACLYDAGERCGPHQHLGPLGTCLCDDELVLQGRECVACGDNEQWQSGACSCLPGFSRTEAGGPCQQAGAGLACEPAAAGSCTDPEFDVCRSVDDAVGYCTKACAQDADCPRGFACDLEATPATCKTAAVGQGEACESDGDCAGKDAAYCEIIQSHVCLVEGCSISDPLSCSEDWTCCDLHALGLAKTLCVPEGTCPTAP